MNLLKKNKRILICLGGGISQIPLIKAAIKKNFQLIVIDKDKKCPGKKLAEIFLNISTYNENKIIRTLNKLIIQRKLITGVINRSSGKAIFTMSKLQKEFNLNGSDPKMIKKILNKNNFINQCIKNKVLIPEIFNRNIKKRSLSKIKFPIIVKPSESKFGKKGISIVKKKENLSKAIKFAKYHSTNNLPVIQKKIDGKDIVMLGAIKNRKFLELTTIDETNLVKNNIIHRFSYRNPSKYLKLKFKKKLIKVANKIIKLFKLNNVPLNLSFRIDNKNKFYLIEINLEISGELIHEKLLKFRNKKLSSFDWYLNVFFLNNKNVKSKKFIKKTIRINDKILRVNNAK